MRDAVIVGAVRSAVGKRNGRLSPVRPDDLAAHVLRELVARVGIDGGESAVPLSDGATHGSNDDGVSHGGPPKVMTSTESRFILQETGRRSTAASRKRRTLTSARVF